MWLRVMPAFDQERKWLVPELEALATVSGPVLFPLGSEGFGNFDFGHVLAADGFGVYVIRVPLGPTPCVAYVFTTGEIWSIDAHHLVVNNVIPFIEPYFIRALENYTTFLRDRLNVLSPYQWIAGIEGVNGRPIEVPRPISGQLYIDGSRGSCMRDPIIVQGTHFDGAVPRTSLRSFFVELYDMCGVQRPDWMDNLTWPPMRY
jgi:hypothetical protein